MCVGVIHGLCVSPVCCFPGVWCAVFGLFLCPVLFWVVLCWFAVCGFECLPVLIAVLCCLVFVVWVWAGVALVAFAGLGVGVVDYGACTSCGLVILRPLVFSVLFSGLSWCALNLCVLYLWALLIFCCFDCF